MRYAAIAVAVLAAFAGLTAVRFLLRASKVRPDPGWDFEPVIPERQQMGWTMATLTALSEAGRLNRIAAYWTAGAVVLAAASSVIATV